MLTSLALIFLVGLFAAAICGGLRLPRIIGMLFTGIILGPHVLGLLDDKILSISSELRQMALIIILLKAGLSLNLADLKKIQGMTLNKYGIVKYDAFDDVGGKMSFALAMLDKENTGFILNAIHSRDNCFLYLKEIVKGESYIMLSAEEIDALRQAITMNSIDLM